MGCVVSQALLCNSRRVRRCQEKLGQLWQTPTVFTVTVCLFITAWAMQTTKSQEAESLHSMPAQRLGPDITQQSTCLFALCFLDTSLVVRLQVLRCFWDLAEVQAVRLYCKTQVEQLNACKDTHICFLRKR